MSEELQVRVADVVDLGMPSVIVDTESLTLLLLDSSLSCEERMEILTDFMSDRP